MTVFRKYGTIYPLKKVGEQMDVFEGVKFKGTFRSYQQKVLDHSAKYLADGKINVVAAPGSGKTILGLELIRRLGKPAVIFSPTTTIRNQWGERYAEMFIGGKEVSFDLRTPTLITSVTYQALNAAVRQTEDEEGDFRSFDLLKTMREVGVGTICLDEAHHLKNEWQKSLEIFLKEMNCTVISLTATPPYDSSPAEWERFNAVCGEIDEEIFVPELVKQGTLCPHQDYIYFNFPTKDEELQFDDFHSKVDDALLELFESEYLTLGYNRLVSRKNDYEFLHDNIKGVLSFCVLCTQAGINLDKSLCKTLSLRPPYNVTEERLEDGVNFLLFNLLSEEERAKIIKIFSSRSLVERGKVVLALNEKLRRRLVSSVGKLKGIGVVSAHEYSVLKSKLRLLVLTDYIKKEELSLIGSYDEPTSVSIVSAFETVRRAGVPVGALSGTLVLLPRSAIPVLSGYGAQFTIKDTSAKDVCIVDFNGDNREKVSYVGRLFEEGHINALVGTKSLLGEGWDAPCVNSLILASVVGSFVLSNQMRGRAIRVDRRDPHKTANIWHLVTVERAREYKIFAGKQKEKVLDTGDMGASYDYETVSRRFRCFVGPDYNTGEIRSGISRITPIEAPYNDECIQKVNQEMMERSSNREGLETLWQKAVGEGSAQVLQATELPKSEYAANPFFFVNIFLFLALACFMDVAITLTIRMVIYNLPYIDSFTKALVFSLIIALFVLGLIGMGKLLLLIIRWRSPCSAMKRLSACVLKTMQQLNLVSKSARLNVANAIEGTIVIIELKDGSLHDQNIFHTAIAELFSPIQNPRYLLIPKGIFGYRYDRALACPEALGKNEEYATALAINLKSMAGKLEPIFTRTANGRKLILKCRNRSFITKNERAIMQCQKISRWE